jgi:hypothetical protein
VQQLAVVTAEDEATLNNMAESKEGDSLSQRFSVSHGERRMAKKHNHVTAWTREEVKALRQLAKENTPTRVIGIKLGRSEASIQGKAHRECISLRPPHGTRKYKF